jgi:hypothetical protein
MAVIWHDVPCRQCGRPHTLALAGDEPVVPNGQRFDYTCPVVPVTVEIRHDHRTLKGQGVVQPGVHPKAAGLVELRS